MGGDRITPEQVLSQEEYNLYLKEIFIYKWCLDKITSSSFCLDLGCGAGYGTSIISTKANKVIGLDISSEAIANGDLKYKKSNCEFRLYDGITIPFGDNTFDVITSFHVIEHVKNDLNFLSEIKRVLKNNGIFILTTPNKTLRLGENQKPWNIFHIREYTFSELEELLGKIFQKTEVFGISSDENTFSIEKKRIIQNQKIANLDLFNLRRIIPTWITSRIVKFIHLILRKQKNCNPDYRLDLDPFAIYKVAEKSDKNSLDLLAINRK